MITKTEHDLAWIEAHPTSPEALAYFQYLIAQTRHEILCRCDSQGCGVLSTQHELLALDALAMAQRNMELALCWRRRGE